MDPGSKRTMTMMKWTLVVAILGLSLGMVDCRKPTQTSMNMFGYYAPSCRKHSASIEDFGGKGDGVTSNTKAFRDAVNTLAKFASDGGSQLYVPAGKWLTGPFSLTSNFTLYLHHEAVILASQDINEWDIIAPLPSYGRGRDLPGERYSNFISGSNLTDVAITGDNGTIDGQGQFWWDRFRSGELKYTRGYLIELMHTDGIFISNLTLLNSPSWNVHPVYSKNVFIQGITILAPLRSPNTDGIDPDSCSNVWIEDCYIVSGDDCIAIKSGWDEYGIRFGMPSQHIYIRKLTCVSPTSAVIALGSEMSGGIQDVHAEDITAIDSEVGVRVKSSPGRGGFVKDIFVRGFTMKTMKWAFGMTGSYGDHPDEKFDPSALPVVRGISYSNMVVENATFAAKMEGIGKAPYTDICISNVTISLRKPPTLKKPAWNCTGIQGTSSQVTPAPCALLPEAAPKAACPFPPMKTNVQKLKYCTYSKM